MRSSRSFLYLCFYGFLMFGLLSPNMTSANPNFSRKYKLDCATCHTVPPQLTRTGIEFRRLGYRFANELKTEKTKPASQSQQPFPQEDEAMKTMDKANCMSCHSIQPGGGGNPLQGVGSKMSREQLATFIGSEDHPGAESAQELSPQDYDLVVLFLASLTEVPEGAVDPWSHDMSDVISVRGRTRYAVQKVTDHDTRNEFRYNDMTFYYLGPVNQYLTIFFETEFEEGFEPNVLAQGTLIYGTPNGYGYIKVGHIRFVRQGVGSLDRPKTLSTDIAVSSKAHLFGLTTDQRGIELGYGFNKNRTLVRVFVTNGIDDRGNGRPVGQQDLNSQKDFSAMVENLFGQKTNTSLAAVYYHGTAPSSSGDISFDRLGLFGTLALNNQQNFEDIRLNGGVLLGYDDVPGGDPNDQNIGFLVGLDKRLGNQFYVSTRYDQFRPTNRVSDNTTHAYTVGMMKQVLTFLRLSAEYQLFQRPGDIDDNRITTEFFVFF